MSRTVTPALGDEPTAPPYTLTAPLAIITSRHHSPAPDTDLASKHAAAATEHLREARKAMERAVEHQRRAVSLRSEAVESPSKSVKSHRASRSLDDRTLDDLLGQYAAARSKVQAETNRLESLKTGLASLASLEGAVDGASDSLVGADRLPTPSSPEQRPNGQWRPHLGKDARSRPTSCAGFGERDGALKQEVAAIRRELLEVQVSHIDPVDLHRQLTTVHQKLDDLATVKTLDNATQALASLVKSNETCFAWMHAGHTYSWQPTDVNEDLDYARRKARDLLFQLT